MSIIKHSFQYCKAAVSDDRNLQIFFTFALAAIVLMLPADVWAKATEIGNDNDISKVVCRIVNVLQGPIARGIAAFGIIFLGFSLFLGKISWGVALALGIGIGAIFGAEQIVSLMAGETGETCKGIE